MPITMNRSRTQEVAFPIRRKNRASLSRSFAKTDIAWHCIGYACSEVITVQTRDLRHPKTHILFETCCSHGISWCQQSIEHLPRWYCKTCNVFVNSLLDQNYVENTHTHMKTHDFKTNECRRWVPMSAMRSWWLKESRRARVWNEYASRDSEESLTPQKRML